MLHNLDFLNTGQTWPPSSEKDRLKRYEEGRLLFEESGIIKAKTRCSDGAVTPRSATQRSKPLSVPDSSRFSTCTKCGATKPATSEFFHRRRRRSNGCHEWCRVCRHLERAQGTFAYCAVMTEAWLRERYEAERMTMQRIADLVGCAIATVRERMQKFGIESRPHNEITVGRRETLKRYHQSENYRAVARRYRGTSKGRAAQVKRRALERSAAGVHTGADLQAQYARQEGKCYWGGGELNEIYHVDHYIPLARGGSNDASNIVFSCAFHNLSRNKKLPDEFLARSIGPCCTI